MTTFDNLLLDLQGGVALLTLNRPKALNALNSALLSDLAAAAAHLKAQGGVRAIILTGAGEKAFVAGADIAQMKDLNPAQAESFAREGQAALAALLSLGAPVIAAVNGFALGGGCELAMACDIIYASDRAKFGQPEVNLGVIPGFGGTQRLTRRVGPGRAIELVTTGRIIDAQEALRIGLADRVFAPEALLDEARKTAQEIASKAPLAVAAARRLVHEGADLALERACSMEAVAFGACFATADQKEGMGAFLEKRAAQFQGR
jgi:enoyl-CoA hydratase